MALPSFFKRKNSKPAPTSAPDLMGEDGPVQAARMRARRRLIGAVVLLAVGVVGFPLLFETKPRPLPGNIPIDLSRRDVGSAAATAPVSVPRPSPAVTELPPEPAQPAARDLGAPAVAASSGSLTAAVPTATAAPSPAPAPLPASAASPPSAVAKADARSAAPTPAASKPASDSRAVDAKAADARKLADEKKAAEDKKAADEKKQADARRLAEEKKQAEARKLAEAKADADRARQALEGRAASAPVANADGKASDSKAGRYVVQVGAFTDANTLREVRAKVEKLGLKTYTQSVDTDSGKRTRVRVGPFATKQEAESASGKLKGAGLPGNVLVL